MLTFVFILKAKQKGLLTEELLRAHVSHLKSLQKIGHLVICGPFADNDQAIQVLRADSKSDAIKIFEEDPFIKLGYYGEYDVHELHEANESNNWLMNIDQTKTNLKK